jgi:hypothetical protein
MARPKKNSQTTAIVVVAFASLVTSCVGREAGNRLTSLAEEDVFVEEKPLPVDDAEYPKLVDTKAPATTAAVTIALDKRFQKLEGFGASVAWYQERLVGQLAKGVYEFLFP